MRHEEVVGLLDAAGGDQRVGVQVGPGPEAGLVRAVAKGEGAHRVQRGDHRGGLAPRLADPGRAIAAAITARSYRTSCCGIALMWPSAASQSPRAAGTSTAMPVIAEC